MKFGLDEKIITRINGIFANYPQISKVVLYGSRAKGNFKPGSDIDLTLYGRELNLDVINRISFELDDLLLPYSFDLSIVDQINNSDLMGHIKRVGTMFYDKALNNND